MLALPEIAPDMGAKHIPKQFAGRHFVQRLVHGWLEFAGTGLAGHRARAALVHGSLAHLGLHLDVLVLFFRVGVLCAADPGHFAHAGARNVTGVGFSLNHVRHVAAHPVEPDLFG